MRLFTAVNGALCIPSRRFHEVNHSSTPKNTRAVLKVYPFLARMLMSTTRCHTELSTEQLAKCESTKFATNRIQDSTILLTAAVDTGACISVVTAAEV